MNTALLLIDFQRDFIHPEGRMPVHTEHMQPMFTHTRAALESARDAGWPIAAIVNAFHRWDPGNLFRRFAAVEGSPGAALDDRMDLSDATVFSKRRGDAFSNPELHAWLQSQKVERVVLCGVYANGCVAATARGALKLGYRVTVLTDAIAAGSDAALERGIQRCARLGAQLTTSGGVA